MADDTQLELARLNMAINGRDAMPDGANLVTAVETRLVASDPRHRPGRWHAGGSRGADV
jgi:hypothetical protein